MVTLHYWCLLYIMEYKSAPVHPESWGATSENLFLITANLLFFTHTADGGVFFSVINKIEWRGVVSILCSCTLHFLVYFTSYFYPLSSSHLSFLLWGYFLNGSTLISFSCFFQTQYWNAIKVLFSVNFRRKVNTMIAHTCTTQNSFKNIYNIGLGFFIVNISTNTRMVSKML